MSELDKEIVNQVVGHLESTNSLVQSLLEDLKENAELVGTLKTELRAVQKELDVLSKAVRGINGSDSLSSRISMLEKDLNRTLKDLEDTEDKRELEERDNKRKAWDMLKIIVGALVGIIGSLLGYLVYNN